MNQRRKNRIIRRLERRIANIEAALENYDDLSQAPGLRGKLVTWLIPRLEEAGVNVDPDNDNAISPDEFKDALDEVAELLDKAINIPEPFDTMMDLGVFVVAELLVGIVFRSEARLKRRLERKKARLAKVKATPVT